MLGQVREGQPCASVGASVSFSLAARSEPTFRIRRVSPLEKEKKRRKSGNRSEEGAGNAVGDNFAVLVSATRIDHMNVPRVG